jgi:hypothetical protein
MTCLDRIDWKMFRRQKEYLVATANDNRLTEEITLIDGLIHLMDAIQDEAMPLDLGEITDTPEDLL